MILQCDQCNTKFRLDDAKLKPGGVKVRCSKCRHVFLAGAEPKHEESEFDAILSGLGAPVPEKGEAVAPPATAAQPAGEPAVPPAAPVPVEVSARPAAPAVTEEAGRQTAAESSTGPDIADFAAFDFPAEPPESPKLPAFEPEPVPDLSGFDFAAEPPAPEPQAASATQGVDYDEFAFDEEPAPLDEEPAPAAEDAFDFGEFSFGAEPEPEPGHPQAPPAALGFGEFDLEAEPPIAQQEPADTREDLEYGDFSFPAEPGPTEGKPAAAARVESTPSAAEEAFDFDAFSFSEEPALQQKEAAPAAKEELDFGEFSFADEPVPLQEESAPAAKEEFDFGDFSFAEEPALLQEEPAAAARQELDFGEFSFDEPPPLPKEEAAPVAAQGGGAFSLSEALQTNETPAAPKAGDDFSFEDFSFPPAAEGTAAMVGGAPEAAAVPTDAGRPAPPQPPVHAAVEPHLIPDGESALDFGMGAGPVPTRAPEQFELDEEGLPPLSIASRRKGRSLLAVSIIVISILVIVALSGAGFYLLQSGPAAFDKLGIGFVAKWFGMESAEEGRITIRNQQAAFYQNKEAGELFVVTGEAVNSFRMARASIHVKVSLFDKNGAVLLQKTAYCGNRLSNEQLTTLPMAKIEAIMNNQFGDSLSNLGVQPGKAIGFVVAIANVPKEAADFGVEVVGSTVAGK